MFEKSIKSIKNIFKKTVTGESVFSAFAPLFMNNLKRIATNQDTLASYQTSLYVNKAISKRAEKVGEIEFELFRGDEQIKKHEILEILNKPNDSFTGPEFWALYQTYSDIFGEVYIYMDKENTMMNSMRINGLYLLRPDRVKPAFDSKGNLEYIEYSVNSKTIRYEGDEIIYFHNPDPANPLRGESLISAGIRAMETSVQIDEYQNRVLQNGGRVDGVFNFKSSTQLSGKQLSEIKESYQEQYGNAKKSGLPLFIAGDAEYKRLGLDPAELAYLETKKVLLDDILMMTGVPKSILGLTSGETFANADASIRIFLRETIFPLLKMLTVKLDETFFPEDDLTLTFNDPTPENTEQKLKEVENGIKNYYMTINEAREVRGLDPIENGDDILAPFNLMPLGREPETNTEKIIKKSDKKAFDHPLRNKEVRRMYAKVSKTRLDSRVKLMKKTLDTYFKEQEKRLTDGIVIGKQKDLLGEIFNKTLEIKLAKDTVLPVLETMMFDAGEEAKEITGSDFVFTQTPEMESWLDQRTSKMAEEINDTTFKKLDTEFAESFSAGETRQQLVDRINNVYAGISETRAIKIARTEVHSATQYATLRGYEQGALPIKIYVWVPGIQGGVRDDHKAIDGQERPLNEPFQYPDGTTCDAPGLTGTAGHDINCECVI